MQALVAVDPTYVWGWQQLAEWYNETDHPQGYLEAASELVRLQPFHPVAFMMRGDARIQTGDRDFCVIGEWTDMASLAAARPKMIAILDQFRDKLEDLGGGLGVTDPVSGEAVVERLG